MKYVKIAGSCLVALLLMSMAMAATASAGPVWGGCAKGAAGTKYTNEECDTSSSSGEWGWAELKNTEKSTDTERSAIVGSLRLKLTKVPVVGTVVILCSVEGTGFTGPGKFSKTEKFAFTCSPGENCEKIEGKVEALDLPWEEEAFETEKSVLIAATHAKSETEGPGVKASCSVLGVKDTVECHAEKGRTVLSTEIKFSGIFVSRFLELENWVETRDVYSSNLGPSTGFVSGSTGVLGPPPQPRRLP
jgi:hypothetical protein